jgi:hypothetical protein
MLGVARMDVPARLFDTAEKAPPAKQSGSHELKRRREDA